MNSTNKGDDELTRTLAREAERFSAAHGADLSMDSVMARAGEIRRGRRMRATMVMAAVVLAVAVPVGVTVLNSEDTARKQPPPFAVEPDYSPIDLDVEENGDLPAIGWAEASAIHLGEQLIPTRAGLPTGLARFDGGFLLATSDDQGNRTARFFGGDGSRGEESWPLGDGGFAVSPEGNVAAFVQPDGTVRAVQDGGRESFGLGRVESPGGLQVGAVVGEDCSTSGGCLVYVNDRGETPRVFAVTPNAPATVVDGPLQSVNTADGTVLAGITTVTQDGSCSAVVTGNAELWATCEEQLFALSPDGEHVLGAQAYGDGIGDTRLVVLDAETGEKRVLDLVVQDGVNIRTTTWEDDEHVLALVNRGLDFAVIRFGLDGTREYALPPQAGQDDLTPPFVLPSD